LSRFGYLSLLLAWAIGRAQPSTPVILISVDTLRADRLGCYQAARKITPHMDSLAKNGTLFSQVSAPVPLTLPSHVSLFTSMYPFASGVQDNGMPFGAGTTLATILKDAGYHTAAFVGGFVLDRRFGLNRGFDVYDSPFDLHNKTATDVGELKRPGAQVAAAAMRWLDQNAGSPFFLFLHLYDLHTPYDLPPNSHHGETGYDAELAYVDRVLGDFLAFLERRALLNKALIVFTSDHGEGLNEHGESTHGYFVYQSTLHVPLIIHWPTAGAKRLSQDRIDQPASLIDVAPTILGALGLATSAGMKGRSLASAYGAEEIYSESLYARNHFGCAALRTLRIGPYKYIDAPNPELYDLSKDPLESRNIYGEEQPRATAMRQKIMTLVGTAPAAKPRTPSPETVNALRSLGYLSGSTASSKVESRIDPKDRIVAFELYGRALALATPGRLAESDSILEKLSQQLNDVADIRISLGLNQQRLGHYAEAAQEFKRALERAPLNAQAHFDLALSEYRLERLDEAVKELQAALALEPWYTRAEELLADIYLQKKDFDQARLRLQHLLSIDPANYSAHYNLGVLATLNRSWPEAERQLLSALQTDATSAEAHNTLGSLYIQIGRTEQAQKEFATAVRLKPGFAFAHYNLALVFKKQQKMDQAAEELRAALKADPEFRPARAELDRMEAAGKR